MGGLGEQCFACQRRCMDLRLTFGDRDGGRYDNDRNVDIRRCLFHSGHNGCAAL